MDAPLAFNQERRLLLEELAEQRSVPYQPFCIPLVFELAGPLDAAALEASLNSIVDRHSALRTAFVRAPRVGSEERGARLESFAATGIFEPGLYVSSILPAADARVRLRRVDAVDTLPIETQIQALVEHELACAFDYETPPPIRAALWRGGATHHVLVIIVHHLVADQWAVKIFERELSRLYAWHMNAGEYPRDPTCQYLDFVQCQHALLDTPAGRATVEYWRQQWTRFGRARTQCRDLGAITPANGFRRGQATDTLTVDRDRLKALTAFTRRAKITLYMLLVAAAGLWLHRRARTPLVAMSANYVNRTSQTENVIGWFTNSHLIGVDCSPDVTVQQLLAGVRESVLRAIAHQAVPLTAVWRALGYHGPVDDQMMLFDLIADHDEATADLEAATGMTMSRRAVPGLFMRSPIDLALQVFVTGHGIRLQALYSLDRFSPPIIHDMLAELMASLDWMIANPSERIAGFAGRTNGERDEATYQSEDDETRGTGAAAGAGLDILASQMDWGS